MSSATASRTTLPFKFTSWSRKRPGAGLKAFSDLLYAAPESTFLAMLQDGSLTSPFDENRMQDLAAYFKEAL